MKNIYVIALAAILFQGCGQKKEMTAPATRPVKTTIVESRSVIRKDFSGIVEAVEYVKLAFRVSGQIINLPVICILGGPALRALDDYTEQRDAGKNPEFKASKIGLTQKLDYWQD